MPQPSCTGQKGVDLGVTAFGWQGRRVVEGRCDGGGMTRDAGVMRLSATDRKPALTAAPAGVRDDRLHLAGAAYVTQRPMTRVCQPSRMDAASLKCVQIHLDAS